MKSGYFRLEHSYYSRGGNKYHGRSSAFHLSNVQNYHANILKGKHVISVGGLSDDRVGLYSDLLAHSNTIRRKNSHLAEGLIVSFDNRMIEAHRDEALKAFVHRVTLGEQIKGYAYEHNRDPKNLHAHVMVIDSDCNGQQLGYFGRNATFRREHSPVKGNPTEWFRKAWEEECNTVLEKHGYDFRIDRRNNLERGLDAPGKHKGWKQSLDIELARPDGPADSIKPDDLSVDTTELVETPIDTTAPKSPDVPLAAEAEMPSLDEQEGPMVISRDGEHPAQIWIADAVEYSTEREYLHAVQAGIKNYEAGKEQALADKTYFESLAREYRNKATSAEKLAELTADQLKPYTREDGSLRGFRIKLWKIDYASPTRAKGQSLTDERVRYEKAHEDALAAKADADRLAAVAEKRAQQAEQSAEAEQRNLDEALARHGDHTTLEKADQIFNDSILDALSHVDIQDVWDAYKERLITKEVAIRAFELMGEHSMVTGMSSHVGGDQRARA